MTAISSYTLPPMTYEPRQQVPLEQSKAARKIELAALTPNNIGQLRKINSVLFPVRFAEKWYKDALGEDSKEVCKFALFNDIPVGDVCCRFEEDGKDEVKLYIMTLGCLAPYRRLGIATKLLTHILQVAGPGQTVQLLDHSAPKPKPKKNKEGKEILQEPIKKAVKVTSVFLHVQTGNDEAKVFYEHFGFKESEILPEYYKIGITPRSAWLLEKKAE